MNSTQKLKIEIPAFALLAIAVGILFLYRESDPTVAAVVPLIPSLTVLGCLLVALPALMYSSFKGFTDKNRSVTDRVLDAGLFALVLSVPLSISI